MKAKTLMIAAGVIGGLIGLGILVNYYLSEDDEVLPSKPKDPQPDKKKIVPQPVQPVAKPMVAREELHNEPDKKVNSPIIGISERVADTIATLSLHEQEHAEIPVPKTKHSLPDSADDEFPLRLGSKGPRVERLQVFLLRNYGVAGKVNGVFDEQTQEQLKKRLHTNTLDEKTYHRYRMGKHVHEQVIIR